MIQNKIENITIIIILLNKYIKNKKNKVIIKELKPIVEKIWNIN